MANAGQGKANPNEDKVLCHGGLMPHLRFGAGNLELSGEFGTECAVVTVREVGPCPRDLIVEQRTEG
jgi:hypothetical protein